MSAFENPYAPPTNDELPLPTMAGDYRASDGLAVSLRVLLAITVALLMLNVWTLSTQIDLIDQILRGATISQAEAEAIDSRVALAAIALVGALLATVIVWCVWQARISKNVQALGASSMQFGPNAWGWFFCPVLNLWRPLSVISEIWEAAPVHAAGQEAVSWEQSSAPGWLMMGWWLPWIVGNLISQLAQRVEGTGDDLDKLAAAARFDMLSFAILAVSGVFAIVLVTALQERVRTRHAARQTKGLL